MSVGILDIDFATQDGRALLAALEHEQGPAIAGATARMERLFLLRSPHAPGLRFAGGLTSQGEASTGDGAPSRLSSSGTGATVMAALASCIGETVERLSQVERPGDVLRTATLRDVARHVPGAVVQRIRQLAASDDTCAAWTRARDAHTDADALVPADWCLRRSTRGALAIPGHALSTGVAAGVTMQSAELRAVLELVERDAASLWWTGGRRGGQPPLESTASRATVQLLGELRQESRDRRSWLLDLTTDLGIPVYAALSTGRDGRGLACGLAARLDGDGAARAAIFEMCQMEVGLLVAEAKAKLAADTGTMSDSDAALIARARGLEVAACTLLHPRGPGSDATLPAGPTDADRRAALLGRLAECGVDVYLVDLTRADLGIPVAAAIAPQLQPMPGDMITDRLARVLAETGGGMVHTHGHALL
ncbi:MAG: YcaO-like family protein [Hyphomicrobiaceae bacterium]